MERGPPRQRAHVPIDQAVCALFIVEERLSAGFGGAGGVVEAGQAFGEHIPRLVGGAGAAFAAKIALKQGGGQGEGIVALGRIRESGVHIERDPVGHEGVGAGLVGPPDKRQIGGGEIGGGLGVGAQNRPDKLGLLHRRALGDKIEPQREPDRGDGGGEDDLKQGEAPATSRQPRPGAQSRSAAPSGSGGGSSGGSEARCHRWHKPERGL